MNHSRGVALPDKIKCDLGGEWKPPSHFSNKQLQIYLKKKNATPAKSGIICRVHKGEPLNDLQCEGPCNKRKELDNFSKATRANGRNWCKACTSWAEANEPGRTPYAAPLAVRSPEEDAECPIVPDSLQDELVFDYDVGYARSAASAFLPNETSSAGSEPTESGDYLGSRFEDGEQSELGGPTQQYGRGPLKNPSMMDQATGASESGAATSTVKSVLQNRAPREFNAYGPDGEMMRMTKVPSIATGGRRSAVSARSVHTSKSGWAKPKQRKTHLEPPEYLKQSEYHPENQPQSTDAGFDPFESDDEF